MLTWTKIISRVFAFNENLTSYSFTNTGLLMEKSFESQKLQFLVQDTKWLGSESPFYY